VGWIWGHVRTATQTSGLGALLAQFVPWIERHGVPGRRQGSSAGRGTMRWTGRRLLSRQSPSRGERAAPGPRRYRKPPSEVACDNYEVLHILITLLALRLSWARPSLQAEMGEAGALQRRDGQAEAHIPRRANDGIRLPHALAGQGGDRNARRPSGRTLVQCVA
jgi:hypothetical protein